MAGPRPAWRAVAALLLVGSWMMLADAEGLTCGGDTSIAVEVGASGKCQCREGWAGPDCGVCLSDAACDFTDVGTGSMCMRTPIFARNLHAACQIGTSGLASFLGGGPGSVLLHLHRPSPQATSNATVELQMLGQAPDATGPLKPAFACSASQCSVGRTPEGRLSVTCLTTKCRPTCTQGVDSFCIPILANMLTSVGSNPKQPFTVLCEPDGRKCAIHEGVLEFYYPQTGIALASCSMGECGRPQDFNATAAEAVTSLSIAAVPASPLRTANVTIFWLGAALLSLCALCGVGLLWLTESKLLGPMADRAAANGFSKEQERHLKDAEGAGLVAGSVHGSEPRSMGGGEGREGQGLRWSEVRYWVGGKAKAKVLLEGAEGEARPGDVTAIMGPSGAGKTTLLDVLSLRDMAGRAEGSVWIGRELVTARNRRAARTRVAYLPQGHMLPSTLTVTEAVVMAATLRSPGHSALTRGGLAGIRRRAEDAMAALRIEHVAKTVIGSETVRGLSGGEKRRVAVAMELTADTPPAVLCLDECTSGLDSYNAEALVDVLVEVAHRRRMAVLMTIHQPKHGTFMRLTRVLLLNRGRCVFAGRPEEVPMFVEAALGYAPPPHSNPADLMIEALFMGAVKGTAAKELGGGMSEDGPGLEWSDIQLNGQDERKDEEQGVPVAKEAPGPASGPMAPSPCASLLVQTLVLSQRFLRDHLRRPWLAASHILAGVYIGVLLGCMYLGAGRETSGIAAIQNRMGIFMLEALFLAFTSVSALPLFWLDRPFMAFEVANSYYKPIAYFISKSLSDLIPLRVVPPVLLATITWAMVGFRGGLFFLQYTLALVLMSCTSAAVNALIGVLASSLMSGILAAMILLLHLLLLTSIFVNFKTMRLSWLGWARFASYFQYGYEALVSNEMSGRSLTDMPVQSGTAILSQLGFRPERLDMDLLVLTCYLGAALTATYVAISRVREKR